MTLLVEPAASQRRHTLPTAKAATLSVTVPVYNEPATVVQVVDRLLVVPAVSDIVTVDDGSDVATQAALEGLRIHIRVRVLRPQQSRGKGAALSSGFAACSGDIVAVQDAGLEYDPEDLRSVVEPIRASEVDVVYGFRALGSRFANARWVRRAANKTLT